MKTLKNLFEILSEEEKLPLYKMYQIDIPDDIKLIQKIGKSLLPAGGVFQTELPYNKYLEKIALHHKISFSIETSEIESEKSLFIGLFKNEFEKMSEFEKNEFIKRLSESGLDSAQIKSLTGLAILSAAQASNFGIYLLASSSVGAIASVLNIPLSFAFYTTMSKTISIVIGPVGFLLLSYPLFKEFKDVKNFDEAKVKMNGLWNGVKSLFIGNYELATNSLKYIAGIRILKNDNYLKLLEINKGTIAKLSMEKYSLKGDKEQLQVQISKLINEINFLTKSKNEKETNLNNLVVKEREKENAIFHQSQQIDMLKSLINRLNT